MRRLLVHACGYSAPAGSDRDGNKTYTDEVTLDRVRLVPVIATKQATEGEAKDDKLTLYYAPELSSIQIELQELARVTWQGKTYTVRSITPCYTKDTDAVHHYEAALV